MLLSKSWQFSDFFILLYNRDQVTDPDPGHFTLIPLKSVDYVSFKLHETNQELPDVQAGFRKGRGIRDQIANIHWIIEKAREFQKNIYFCFTDYALTVYITTNWKVLKVMGIPDHLACPWEICMQVKKQQLELDMEQWTGSKLGKEYVKTMICQPAYLAYMQSTSWKISVEG